jgi:hypothetical protein
MLSYVTHVLFSEAAGSDDKDDDNNVDEELGRILSGTTAAGAIKVPFSYCRMLPLLLLKFGSPLLSNPVPFVLLLVV